MDDGSFVLRSGSGLLLELLQLLFSSVTSERTFIKYLAVYATFWSFQMSDTPVRTRKWLFFFFFIHDVGRVSFMCAL